MAKEIDNKKSEDIAQDTEEKKEIVNENNSNSSLLGKFRENPWIISTFVLGLVVIILLFNNFMGTGSVISNGDVLTEDEAGDYLLDYYEGMGATGLTIDSVEEAYGLYKVNFEYQGAIVPIYMTKDGKLAGNLNTLSAADNSETETTTTTEVEKSDVPEVGLYIWSYCPYGVTALEPFAQVAELLGDSANFRVYLYYAGHGEYEVQQNKIQACIQNLGYEDEYWKYAKTFVSEIYEKCHGDIECDLNESIALMDSIGIDSEEVLACVDTQGDALLEEDYNAAKAVGVTGSPSLVINGAKASAARNADAYKTAVCSAFNTAPATCDTELSSTGTTASGSC